MSEVPLHTLQHWGKPAPGQVMALPADRYRESICPCKRIGGPGSEITCGSRVCRHREGSCSWWATGVTRESGGAPPLGWSYAPRHSPPVGPQDGACHLFRVTLVVGPVGARIRAIPRHRYLAHKRSGSWCNVAGENTQGNTRWKFWLRTRKCCGSETLSLSQSRRKAVHRTQPRRKVAKLCV